MKLFVTAAAAVALLSAAPAFADADLAKAKNCMACHGIDQKLVGPAYKDVAAKYAGQDGAVALLSEHIQKGSTGIWGPIPMPPNPQVSAEEATKLAEWVLSLK